ncbi:sensor histidine kinase [Thalassoporum mexicanum]|nr:ATP-binding protein [Pseudanabaena sp. PCC 7367]
MTNLNAESEHHQSDSKTKLNWFDRLSISKKISLGYFAALGVAVLGNLGGVLVGNAYQSGAQNYRTHAAEEAKLIFGFRNAFSDLPGHETHLFAALGSPNEYEEEYTEYQATIVFIEDTWQQLQDLYAKEGSDELHSQDEDIQALGNVVSKYDRTGGAYLADTKELLAQIPPERVLQEDLADMEAQLVEFNRNISIKDLRDFNRLLDTLIAKVEVHEQQAVSALAVAENTRGLIIFGSMLISIVIAIVIAVLTSRAIVRPLQATNKVAKQVIKESDFDLRAPITTGGEVAELTTTLNELIARVKRLLEEQKAATAEQLLQSEKMSSLGRMLAGVAHEINNPVNFIYGNLAHANNYTQDLFDLIDTYQAETTSPSPVVEEKLEEVDLDFLAEDLPKLLESMKIGADRARKIVLSLKNFSRIDESQAHPVDIHDAIDSTLLILNNRIKNQVEIKRNYGDIPAIEAFSGSLFQVVMNILSNALDAVQEKAENEGKITITTERKDRNWVQIRIADNGVGIAPEHLTKIFETFFTTKPMGVGTGLGLSISHQMITEKHHGTLTCTSELGVGTEFTIALPIKQADLPFPTSDKSTQSEQINVSV